MKIGLKLFATLRDFGPRYQEMEVADKTTVQDIASALRIPGDMPMISLVNGDFAEAGKILNDGDTVAFFPPIAGG